MDAAESPRLVLHPDARIEWASPPASELFGPPLSDLVGERLLDFVDPADEERARAWWDRVLEGGAGIEETVLRVKAGEGARGPLTMRAELASVGPGETRVICWANAEGGGSSGAERWQFYRKLFEHDVAGAARISLDGEILDVNRSMARLLGASDPSRLKGGQMVAFRRSLEEMIGTLRKEGSVEDVEIPIYRPDGTEGWALLNSHLAFDRESDEPVVWALAVDITDRKRAEVSLTILLVEDELLTKRSTRATLEDLGHRVVAVADTETALEAFEQHEIDVLLTDVSLPDASGLELARELRARRPDLPVILASGYGPRPGRRRSGAPSTSGSPLTPSTSRMPCSRSPGPGTTANSAGCSPLPSLRPGQGV